jgi:RNA polymerase sigma-70 factor (ECF subfamily)
MGKIKKMKIKEEQFARLVREHKGTIYTVCYMFSQDEDAVNDLFQETLINMWKGIDGFREESKISTWIYRVALNTCLLWERKKKKEVQTVPLSIDINFFEDDDANSSQVRQLHERIGKLGLVDRAIVMMWLEDMSYDEIGAVLGITAQNVGVKLFRIKEQLKKMHD